jgi:hypothetical protein
MKIVPKIKKETIPFNHVSVGECFFYGDELYLKTEEVFIAKDLKREIDHVRDLKDSIEIETEECNAICLTREFCMSRFCVTTLVTPVDITLIYE